jgi:phosphoadenosine phosphosulfate reductase
MAWLDLTSGSLMEAPDYDVLLAPESDDDALKAASQKGAVAIQFEKYRDGRGFTLARALRDEFQFKGLLVAAGTLIPDQAQFLLRVGFNIAQIGEEARLPAWQSALNRFQLYYQKAPVNVGLSREEFMANQPESWVHHLREELEEAAELSERMGVIKRYMQDHMVFSTSLQKEDQVILHGLSDAKLDVRVFTLDTLRLFAEVEETLEKSEKRYGLTIERIQPDPHDLEELIARDGVDAFYQSVTKRKNCCFVRKVKPLKRALQGAGLWITGLRQSQSEGRANVPLAEWDDAFGVIKVNPVADWSDTMLETYILEHNVLVNPMHERGYPSIGCEPCTRAIKPGEDIRAGRWWWENDNNNAKECGLHVAGGGAL